MLCTTGYRQPCKIQPHRALREGDRQTEFQAVGQPERSQVCRPAVVASEKGVVVGRLTFREDGDLIDCQRMGVGGKAVPPNVDKVSKEVRLG